MNTRRSSTFAISLAITLGIVGGLRAEQVEEKYPDGQIKARYTVKAEKKHGKYEEFHENGKPKVRANYLNDELAGAYQSFDESGSMRLAAAYRAGKLHGKYLERTPKGQPALAGEYSSGRRHGKFIRYANGKADRTLVYRDDDVVALDGVVTHPYTTGEIAQALSKIYSTQCLPPTKPKFKVAEKATPSVDYAKKLGNFPTDEEMNAVRRLNAYRFLCGLPADVYLNPEYTYFAYKGAALCAKLGDIEHEPPNPGLPQEEYADGFRGTSNSNLHKGQPTMSRSLDGYMNDSDDKNIKHVGHRRWCLNVEMQATGFGDKEKFHAMWSMDHGRRDIPKWQAVPYPARGYMPSDYFSPRHAWSLLLNTRHFSVVTGCGAKIYPLDETYKKGKPLELDYENYHPEMDVGTGQALIFRPKKIDVSPGHGYWVEIVGLKSADGRPTKIEYPVEFVEIKVVGAGKRAKGKVVEASGE